MTFTRLISLAGFLTVALLTGCAPSSDPDGGAAHPGVFAELETEPMVMIDDESGTDVRVFVHFDHHGGPDAETLEVISAGLRLDLEPHVDLELAIPDDHPTFEGLADGEALDFELRGTLPDNHEAWGLCLDPDTEEADGQRLSLDLVLRVTPGANDDADEFEFESRAVTLACSHTG
jgi:hypothetical protein